MAIFAFVGFHVGQDVRAGHGMHVTCHMRPGRRSRMGLPVMGVCRGVGRTSEFDPGDCVVVRQAVPDTGEVPDREDAGQPVRVRGDPVNDVGDTGRRDRRRWRCGR